MPSLIDRILKGREIQQRRPWPRAVVGAHLWRFVANELAQGRLGLLGLWGAPSTVHLAIMDEATGETVVRLEERLGYTHKGVEGLMAGADLERAVQLAGRVSGDSTVAYAYAFSRAAEAALELVVPDRAVWLRALLAELERLANHLGDIGAICNDASFTLMHALCSVLRESVLRASDSAFGHRLMRDIIVPGGVPHDLSDEGKEIIRATLDIIRLRFPALVELYDSTPSR